MKYARLEKPVPSQVRVLVLAEDEQDAQFIVLALQQAGCEIFHHYAGNMADLAVALTTETWDVILATHTPPQLSALTALNFIQENQYDIPLIVISEGLTEKGALAVMQAGAHDYIDRGDLVRLAVAVRREAAAAGVRREWQQRQKHLELLNQITFVAASILDEEKMLCAAANLLRKLLQADGIYFTLWDEGRKKLIPVAAHEGMHHLYRSAHTDHQDATLASTVLQTRQFLLISDTRNSPYVSKQLQQLLGARSLLVLPLIAGEQKLGAAIVAFAQSHLCRPEEVARAEQAIGQIALAVARMRLLETERRQRELAETLREVASALASTLEREQVLTLILQQLRRVVVYDSASIFLLNGEVLESVAYRSLHEKVRQAMTLSVNDLVHVRQILQLRQPISIADTAVDSRWRSVTETELIRCWLGVPMLTQDRLIGILNLNHTMPNFYTPADVQVATTFAGQAAIAIENARLYAQQQAYAAELEQRVQARTQALARANARLQELDRLKSKFVADVTHELRTPVTNLKLYLDLMEHAPAQKQAHYLRVLRHQADRLAVLITDILSLSRLEQQKTAVTFAPLDFNCLVTEVVQQHMASASAAGLELRCHTAANLPPVWGHQTQLAQVVTNLVSNAINYTPVGMVQVSTAWDDALGMVQLTVQDTGMGIPEAERPFLFDRFYRGEQTGQLSIPGTGLGLAIVQEIVALHQGKIGLESQVGEGSTFLVWLPAAPDAAEQES